MGSVLCASPLGERYVPGKATNTSGIPGSTTPVLSPVSIAPPSGATVAPLTLTNCGAWHVAKQGDTCANITMTYAVSLADLGLMNPSINVNTSGACSASIVPRYAYCVGWVASFAYTPKVVTYATKSPGCWTSLDAGKSQVLTGPFWTNSTGVMSLNSCGMACLQDHYSLAGLVGSNSCVCGDQIPLNSVRLSTSPCTAGQGTGVSLYTVQSDAIVSIQFSDKGCYSSSALITGSAPSAKWPANNTAWNCADLCLPTYPYFGVSKGDTCLCGTGVTAGATPFMEDASGQTTQCNLACPGGSRADCGGSAATRIYSSRTTNSTTNTTQPADPIVTPAPAHPGMVNYCNKFVKVNPGDSCDSIAFWNGVAGTQWVNLWNAGVGANCESLQVNTYVCIAVIGGTPTVAANGVATPKPTHPGMVGNCNKFTYTKPADTCDSLALWNGVAGTQWVKLWNSGVGANCQSLQADAYVCIGVIGGTPTTAANGVATPVSTQAGMVSNCNKFVWTRSGDSCDSIAFWNGVAGTQLVKLWNSGVGANCQSLQVDRYVCIGVIAGTPTNVVGPNGIATPVPTQTGMVSKCNKFVKVNSGDTCNIVAFFNGPISTENFILWNSGVGAQCTNLQADTYACIGVTG